MNGLRIQKWGNSQGIRLPKEVLKQSGLSVGDSLECNIEEGKIVLKPISGVRRRKYDLAQLLSNVPTNFKNPEYDFGEPVGGEA
jgi:antitoxin MazE